MTRLTYSLLETKDWTVLSSLLGVESLAGVEGGGGMDVLSCCWVKDTFLPLGDNNSPNEIEEEKKKHQRNQIETLEEKDNDNVIENRTIGKVDELFPMESNQHGKDKENEIPGEEIPIMGISSSKESSTPVHHLLKGIFFDYGTVTSASIEEGRPSKKTSNEKNKDKVQMDADGLEALLTESSDTATENYDLPPFNCKNVLLLIDQHRVDCKDPISLLKIRDAVLRFGQSIEL
ncbi:ankyrin repeat domain-containing protein 26 [Phascolarctos cinereus]|uniref:Ankyrin repeat domain-containing protein 26 n=1 Tax=Phascolarctos cinereus TaxID=38626 RepID=A0A6P5JQG9_PHACI|nr:ankyrin repeat domain-containing protein 26 [Phascolarctos cinereus]